MFYVYLAILIFQPEDWDNDEDGEWTAPTIPNPEYKGPWTQKVCKSYLMEFIIWMWDVQCA